MTGRAERRAQLAKRLERQQVYELGDWTRGRYLLARQEVISELAEVDATEIVARHEQDIEALEHLGVYVREVKAAWGDADKAIKPLLVRTPFEQMWVLGDRSVAVKPVAQFVPFFQLMRGTVSRGETIGQGDTGVQLR